MIVVHYELVGALTSRLATLDVIACDIAYECACKRARCLLVLRTHSPAPSGNAAQLLRAWPGALITGIDATAYVRQGSIFSL